MRILVTFAVEAEFAPWRKLRKFVAVSSDTKQPLQFSSHFQTDADHEIVVVLTGIGETISEESLKSSGLLAHLGPEVMISSGFAGALKEKFSPGTIVAPVKVRTLKNHANVDAESGLRQEAVRLGASPIDNLITLDRLVKTAEEKSQLSFFGEAIDMESAIVMSRFATTGAQVMALRVISDGAAEDLPLDFDRCLTPQGAIRPMSLVNQIVKRPENLPNLIRFGRQSYKAAQTLAEFLEKFVLSVPAVCERLSKA
jgi:nucleoside phosphorylase